MLLFVNRHIHYISLNSTTHTLIHTHTNARTVTGLHMHLCRYACANTHLRLRNIHESCNCIPDKIDDLKVRVKVRVTGDRPQEVIQQLIYHETAIHINPTQGSKPIHHVHVNVIMANMQTTLSFLVHYWPVSFDCPMFACSAQVVDQRVNWLQCHIRLYKYSVERRGGGGGEIYSFFTCSLFQTYCFVQTSCHRWPSDTITAI